MVESILKTKVIGVPIPRKEDDRLLRGLGRYTSDYIEKEMRPHVCGEVLTAAVFTCTCFCDGTFIKIYFIMVDQALPLFHSL